MKKREKYILYKEISIVNTEEQAEMNQTAKPQSVRKRFMMDGAEQLIKAKKVKGMHAIN